MSPEEIARFRRIAPYMPLVLPADWRFASRMTMVPGFHAEYEHVRAPLLVMLSCRLEHDEQIWLHMSIGHPKRLPTWEEFRDAKDIFIGQERTALQVLPKRSEYVNFAKHVLHAWSCLTAEPTPDFRIPGTGMI